MSDTAFQRVVNRAWEKMRADDPAVTREYVEAYLRLIWQVGAAQRKREAVRTGGEGGE